MGGITALKCIKKKEVLQSAGKTNEVAKKPYEFMLPPKKKRKDRSRRCSNPTCGMCGNCRLSALERGGANMKVIRPKKKGDTTVSISALGRLFSGTCFPLR